MLIREFPSIGFPVKGKNSQTISSFFGDPRDGGTREHHGVDIFAPPHLHFGIYSMGPNDPYHVIAETDTVPSMIVGDSLSRDRV